MRMLCLIGRQNELDRMTTSRMFNHHSLALGVQSPKLKTIASAIDDSNKVQSEANPNPKIHFSFLKQNDQILAFLPAAKALGIAGS
jgi:hypothetical protein